MVSYGRLSLYAGSLGLSRGVVSEQWPLKAVDCLVQVVSNTG